MTIFKTPPFWYTPDQYTPFILKPLGWLYGIATLLRYHLTAPFKPSVPVICVGNFTAGGAGKTPVTITLCTLLKSMGYTPVILSRGYGGKLRGPALVNPHHTAAEVGDEPLLLAQHAPVVIARDKILGAMEALVHGDIILMDDGLQNPALHKTIAFAVVDGTLGMGNGHCIPAGPLRAPLNIQRKWVDAIIHINPKQALPDALKAIPIHTARSAPASGYADLRNTPVLLYTGIATPEKIHTMLVEAGATIAHMQSYPDHHNFTEAEAEELLATAREQNLTLATTAKDHARLRTQTGARKTLADLSTILDVTIKFDNAAALRHFLSEKLPGK